MKFSRLFMLCVAILLVGGILTACGAEEDPATQDENPAEERAETEASGNNATEDESDETATETEEFGGEVNVYTARHYEVDETVFEQFTEDTGIEVNAIKGSAEELIERLKREGSSTEADLFVTVDGGILNIAKEADILQPMESDVLEEQVPENLKDPDNHWIGLSTRARIIAYDPERVEKGAISTYEDLAGDDWAGKVLVRSSDSMYNQSLLASFIELQGEAEAETWAQGVVDNMARNPEGGDRDQAKAIAAGIGDVAIMNSYYVGLMVHSQDAEEAKVGESLEVLFPNQETTGTHINISGAGLTKHSKNTENAVKLVEYWTSPDIQSMSSQTNYEFPVNPEAEKAELLESWGDFKVQEIDFGSLGQHNPKAVEIFNKVGWQ